jgi:hypothetical protein
MTTVTGNGGVGIGSDMSDLEDFGFVPGLHEDDLGAVLSRDKPDRFLVLPAQARYLRFATGALDHDDPRGLGAT